MVNTAVNREQKVDPNQPLRYEHITPTTNHFISTLQTLPDGSVSLVTVYARTDDKAISFTFNLPSELSWDVNAQQDPDKKLGMMVSKLTSLDPKYIGVVEIEKGSESKVYRPLVGLRGIISNIQSAFRREENNTPANTLTLYSDSGEAVNLNSQKIIEAAIIMNRILCVPSSRNYRPARVGYAYQPSSDELEVDNLVDELF